MSITLRHDRRLMPQEPLHLIQVYPSLNHPRCERMAKIMEMKIVDLRDVERHGQRSPDVAPIERRMGVTVEYDVSCPRTHRVFLFQELKHSGVHRDRPSLSVIGKPTALKIFVTLTRGAKSIAPNRREP